MCSTTQTATISTVCYPVGSTSVYTSCSMTVRDAYPGQRFTLHAIPNGREECTAVESGYCGMEMPARGGTELFRVYPTLYNYMSCDIKVEPGNRPTRLTMTLTYTYFAGTFKEYTVQSCSVSR